MNLLLRAFHFTPIRFGLYTGIVIILFNILNHFVAYNIIKLDYYLVFVSVCFLVIGLRIRKPDVVVKEVVVTKEVAEITREVTKEVYIEKPEARHQHIDLTYRETQILKLIAAGKTNKEIAALNCIELSTVKTHINNLYGKLPAKNRREASKKYAEMIEKGLSC